MQKIVKRVALNDDTIGQIIEIEEPVPGHIGLDLTGINSGFCIVAGVNIPREDFTNDSNFINIGSFIIVPGKSSPTKTSDFLPCLPRYIYLLCIGTSGVSGTLTVTY